MNPISAADEAAGVVTHLFRDVSVQFVFEKFCSLASDLFTEDAFKVCLSFLRVLILNHVLVFPCFFQSCELECRPFASFGRNSLFGQQRKFGGNRDLVASGNFCSGCVRCKRCNHVACFVAKERFRSYREGLEKFSLCAFDQFFFRVIWGSFAILLCSSACRSCNSLLLRKILSSAQFLCVCLLFLMKKTRVSRCIKVLETFLAELRGRTVDPEAVAFKIKIQVCVCGLLFLFWLIYFSVCCKLFEND